MGTQGGLPPSSLGTGLIGHEMALSKEQLFQVTGCPRLFMKPGRAAPAYTHTRLTCQSPSSQVPSSFPSVVPLLTPVAFVHRESQPQSEAASCPLRACPWWTSAQSRGTPGRLGGVGAPGGLVPGGASSPLPAPQLGAQAQTLMNWCFMDTTVLETRLSPKLQIYDQFTVSLCGQINGRLGAHAPKFFSQLEIISKHLRVRESVCVWWCQPHGRH